MDSPRRLTANLAFLAIRHQEYSSYFSAR